MERGRGVRGIEREKGRGKEREREYADVNGKRIDEGWDFD